MCTGNLLVLPTLLFHSARADVVFSNGEKTFRKTPIANTPIIIFTDFSNFISCVIVLLDIIISIKGLGLYHRYDEDYKIGYLILKYNHSFSNQMFVFLASSNALLSLTPRYAEVAVIEDCPSNRLTASTLCVFS